MRITFSDDSYYEIEDICIEGAAGLKIVATDKLEEALKVFSNTNKLGTMVVSDGSIYNGYSTIESISAKTDGVTSHVTIVLINENTKQSLNDMTEKCNEILRNLQEINHTDAIEEDICEINNDLSDIYDAIIELGELLEGGEV